MSYEPKLIIKLETLEPLKKDFELVSYGIIPDEKTRGGEENKTVMEYLSEVYFKYETYDIFGTNCKICQPCFSSYNKAIRDFLKEFDIEYVEIN